MPPKKGKKEEALVEDNKSKKKGKAKVDDEKNVSEDEVEIVKPAKATKKKKGKKGDDEDIDEPPKETQKAPTKKAAPKKKGKGKGKNDDWSDSEEPAIVNNASHDESDEKEIVPVKKQPKKKQKAKGKGQDWSDNEDVPDILANASESDEVAVLPEKKKNKKQKAKPIKVQSDSENDMVEDDIPLSEEEVVQDIPESNPEEIEPMEEAPVEDVVAEDEVNGVEIENEAEPTNPLNKTYVIQPRVTRSQAKKGAVEEVSEQMEDLVIGKKKTKPKKRVAMGFPTSHDIMEDDNEHEDKENNVDAKIPDATSASTEPQKKLTHKEKKKLKKEVR